MSALKGEMKMAAKDDKASVIRVEAALKSIVESDLARQRVGIDVGPGNAYFSRGVIFSKSGNGTPFSRGIIFSKSGSEGLRPDESEIIQQMLGMEEHAFHALADRLVTLKQTKAAAQVAKG